MTQEEKELLLKDLCGRLPFGVKVKDLSTQADTTIEVLGIKEHFVLVDEYTRFGNVYDSISVEYVKPYLRPMSSMTTNEEYEYHQYCAIDFNDFAEEHLKLLSQTALCFSNHIDWLNAHHFDYRELISMGLALEAPEGMYK